MARRIQKVMMGSDHGGYEMKEDLKEYVRSLGYEVVDFGCPSPDPVDYPDIAFLVADAVAENEGTVGIMIDGVGVASAMVANKVPGIRAALCWELFSVNNAREHNDANVLVLGGRVLGKGLAREMCSKFLKTEFAGGRHQRRVNKIMAVESRFLSRK